MHRYWMKTVPDYAEVFEVARLDVLDQWRDFYADVTTKGLEERTYGADGKLKQLRIRQDAGLIKGLMMSVDDEFAPDRDKGSGNVVIILNHTNEGGWTEDEAAESDNIPHAEVVSVDEGAEHPK